MSGFWLRLVYTSLFYLLTPLILARLYWRGRKLPAYRQRWAERFGYYNTPAASGGALWFHAVSVGEAEAAFPLIRRMQARFPELPCVVTTTTPTGSRRVAQVLGETVLHVYLPYDMPDCVRRFLAHFQPRLAVIMETEIWPNLYRACRCAAIPVVIVNARVSGRSARGYARLGALTREALADVRCIAAQTEADRQRFVALGSRCDETLTTGNIKFDIELPAEAAANAAMLRKNCFGVLRPIWIAASTHEGEETQVLEAFKRIRADHPELVLILAPRHPERFDAVAELCCAAGWKLVRRTDGETACEADVFLLDTLGELKQFYGASDIAFVGGSLAPVGGHNLMEPAAVALPVLVGPCLHNFKAAADALLSAGGALLVHDAMELAAACSGLLSDQEYRKHMGVQALAFVNAGQGALLRVEALLSGLLEAAGDPGKR
ncbi:3-deoxy-D-manno-octulosonic acid transferase [Candidatus Methylospira mobilis]|uniref:3-deoxy-D-manno-octulosonic acid transferase n=1 Tax=Candidatus Methylospira mobilis TaxID=1808979 RepID=A0A5Q0BP91_9GAMM|nr:lipid IV(A) 3-deoxy-D-manno-octulosonic acid transferase [Candidatus Methylospira mobilis]QFY43556.1 3-deoxy-D-manno-octulosonic acid transferase [Candidatus Methylospira mobilis]